MRGTYPEIVQNGTLFETFNRKDAVVWIDPLDGTNDFISGNLPAVTVLIGLSIKGTSRIGIVHNPFNEDDSAKGRTLFGTIEHGLFKLDYNETESSGESYKNRSI
jgi:3'-phosphoadenosine 5'-phosphosulfate (PAPS) 3'-phosphatase